MSGCNWVQSFSKPAIEPTTVTSANEGGQFCIDDIAGRVNGAESGWRIELYAKERTWWVHPFAGRPFTRIGSDSTWKSDSHLRCAYPALLLKNGYRLPREIGPLSSLCGHIVGQAIVEGLKFRDLTHKAPQFSKYLWKVRDASSAQNGVTRECDPASAWTDKFGAVHLLTSRSGDNWKCLEASLSRILGCGNYRFSVRYVTRFEPSVVLNLYTRDGVFTDEIHRQMDAVISNYRNPTNKHAGFVVQPYCIPENASDLRFL